MKVFGYPGRVKLFEGSLDECIQWTDRYTRNGDFGGYEVIVVESEDGRLQVQYPADE